ncbi:MAG: ornithine carbamoyltransferase [Bacteroidales bacterium]|nr:ornithine carbamoyltransferase [Candidatus Egerieousia equi]
MSENKHFLKILDFTPEEIKEYLSLAAKLKADKKNGKEEQLLKGKNIAVLFEKASTRTRCSFEVAASDQGGYATYLGSVGSHLGIDESMDDTARVLGRMFDGIAYRGYGQYIVERIAKLAGVPVWNALTDEAHPTQTLADLLTIMEHINKPLSEVKIAFVGDTRFNTCNSLFAGCVKMGMDFRAVSPKKLQPGAFLLEKCKEIAKETGARITVTDNIEEGVKDCDFIYTDVWVSMGEPAEVWQERVDMLKPFQVNAELMKKTGNPNCKFMHCLPAYHDTSIKVGKEILEKFGLDGVEVTHEVFESDASIVFDEAENRMHTIKAIMVKSLA